MDVQQDEEVSVNTEQEVEMRMTVAPVDEMNADFDDINESGDDDDRKKMHGKKESAPSSMNQKRLGEHQDLAETKKQLKMSNQQYLRKNKPENHDVSMSQKSQSKGDNPSFSEESDDDRVDHRARAGGHGQPGANDNTQLDSFHQTSNEKARRSGVSADPQNESPRGAQQRFTLGAGAYAGQYGFKSDSRSDSAEVKVSPNKE